MSGLATAGDQGAQRGRKGGAKRKKIDLSAGFKVLSFNVRGNLDIPVGVVYLYPSINIEMEYVQFQPTRMWSKSSGR